MTGLANPCSSVVSGSTTRVLYRSSCVVSGFPRLRSLSSSSTRHSPPCSAMCSWRLTHIRKKHARLGTGFQDVVLSIPFLERASGGFRPLSSAQTCTLSCVHCSIFVHGSDSASPMGSSVSQEPTLLRHPAQHIALNLYDLGKT